MKHAGRFYGGAAIAAIVMVLIQGCAPGDVTDPQGTWIVTKAPEGWPDTKYVITETTLDIYWTTLAVSADLQILPSSPGNGRMIGTVSSVTQGSDQVGGKWYMIYDRSGTTLNLTWSDSTWKIPKNTTIKFTLQ